ncbi:hypothetical protein BOTBODRAFT_32892 [Botryobasidium botryosum FD-172 SS1]|uniref:Mediator of RNA polymerase II transcription subunit 10 n=1 Tax=Botryobasidium botryosum (strain FD-172 SS1) TaxID=930990 RepID=A0A067MEX0_BOTB1|nr:hypothetical protein BOTBODRAFT_32892 [Botryobasidium botryosum FD-172 SS1]
MPTPVPMSSSNLPAINTQFHAPTSPGSQDSGPPSPEGGAALGQLESGLRDLTYSLTQLGVCATDVQPPRPEDGPLGRVADKVNDVIAKLHRLDVMKDSVTTHIPFDVLQDIDNGRNPKQVAKMRIEQAAGENQFTHGKIHAVQTYRGLLGAALSEHFPALAPHIEADLSPTTPHA